MIVDKMPGTFSVAEEVEELALLLPSWQVMALAEAAESEGLTVAQLMRRLINQTLAPFPGNKLSSA
jgi:hypothetical protein